MRIDKENKHYKHALKNMVEREKQREINDEDADLDLPERIRVIHGEELNGNDG